MRHRPRDVDALHTAENAGRDIHRSDRGRRAGQAGSYRSHRYRGQPIYDDAGERDETAMQIAVLQHWDFHDRAKAVLKRDLGWSPWVKVE